MDQIFQVTKGQLDLLLLNLYFIVFSSLITQALFK